MESTIKQDNGAYFPLELYIDLLRLINNHREKFQIITYDDLSWNDDYDYTRNYSIEWETWKSQIKSNKLDSKKIYILIQHDVDANPERTMQMLYEEEKFNVPSNVMIFNKLVDKEHLRKNNEVKYKEYNLDVDYLKYLEKSKGFVIGYHCNAFEQAVFNMEKAKQIFQQDVKDLSKHFNIKYFSPHGGVRNPEGVSNAAIEVPDILKNQLRWVHNGHSARFHGTYSDGGINTYNYKPPEERNMLDFIRKWEPGKRYRILIHPQYFNQQYTVSEILSEAQLYNKVLENYTKDVPFNLWEKKGLQY